jgi:O-antigen ligase
MPSKLSRYCEGIIEASWLAALILTPLFFNVYSARIFEPDKLSMLRSLALLITGAWLVMLVETGFRSFNQANERSEGIKAFWRFPLAAPVGAFLVVTLLAALLSVAPSVSFWGSYQRLQGAYTTLSYLVIFAAVAVHLRRHAQVARLVTVVIITSLPISLYGIIQRFDIDPIPWGGDVVERVAGHMGNAIFLAAYLIMVFPLTLVRIFDAVGSLARDREDMGPHLLRASLYIFIAALQLITLYFTGSRGPWLGWMAGMFFFFVLFSLAWGKRRLVFLILGIAVLSGLFIIILNIPNSILEPLRSDPYIGRLGHLLEADVDTGRVRVLIWESAAEMAAPHSPLEYPDGRKDALNALRPLIGYGPESMYVAFNPFYPPELAHWERRNASPDRSHNETWDALVMTGIIGLVVYLILFGTVFFYGLKWLGLASGPRQRALYIGLFLMGGFLGAAVLVSWRGIAYFGIGLPFGMIAGLLVYLTLAALFGEYHPPRTRGEGLRAALLIGLLSAILAHFAEIHFGIAIAATRLYFWTYAGLMLVVGLILPRLGEYGQVAASEQLAASSETGSDAPASAARASRQPSAGARKKRSPQRQSGGGRAFKLSPWLRQAAIPGLLTAVILSTLAFNYGSNALGGSSIGGILRSSLTRLQAHDGAVSYGILILVVVSWAAAALLSTIESWLGNRQGSWVKAVGAGLLISFVLGAVFWVWHAFSLQGLIASSAQQFLDQVARYEGLFSRYVFYLLVLILAAALFLPREWPAADLRAGSLSILAAPAALLVVLVAVVVTNLRVVQADIVYKLADPFVNASSWNAATTLYNRAIQLAPNEDFYYLFLGRAYLEQARNLEDEAARDRLFRQAARDLETAQGLNPLNTDHTANLARLYSMWATYSSSPADRQERAWVSDAYFQQALTLSPNNVRIRGEWALLHMNAFADDTRAEEILNSSLEIDDRYDWTRALIGDLYLRQAYDVDDAAVRDAALRQAEASYLLALELADEEDEGQLFNYSLALANVYENSQEPLKAAQAYEFALALQPQGASSWQIEERIALRYQQAGDRDNALEYARRALSRAPEDQAPRLQALISELER